LHFEKGEHGEVGLGARKVQEAKGRRVKGGGPSERGLDAEEGERTLPGKWGYENKPYTEKMDPGQEATS